MKLFKVDVLKQINIKNGLKSIIQLKSNTIPESQKLKLIVVFGVSNSGKRH
jgi:hypothetical protein